jgi:hypothetical protein
LCINADALFPLLVNTISGIEKWKVETASQSRGVIRIVPIHENNLLDNLQRDHELFSAILLVISYLDANLSSLVLHAYSIEPIDIELAQDIIPVNRIFDLSGQGHELRL